MSGAGRCPCCGREVEELHYGVCLGGVCCERCYCRAAPPISREARRWRPQKSPVRRPKPDGYARLVDRVYAALGRVGEVYSLGGGQFAGYCPLCCEGTVLIRLIAGDPPFLRYDGCDAGCDAEQVARRL